LLWCKYCIAAMSNLSPAALGGDSKMVQGKAPAESNPENIFFILLPAAWKDRIKNFNKDFSYLRFMKRLETPEFLKSTSRFLDNYFNVSGRGSSVGVEIVAGLVNFFSSMYILGAIPVFMAAAGYNADTALAAISLGCGIANILSGIISNLPIIIAPPVPVSIYFTSTIHQASMSVHKSNMVVVYSGVAFLIMALIAPIGRFFANIIPEVIQLSTTIGIGLFVVLYGFQDLGIVQQGRYTLLELGNIDAQVAIGISAIIVTAWGIIVKSKISLLTGLVWGTFLWWTSQDLWPQVWTSMPKLRYDEITQVNETSGIILILELFVLNLITCFGLCTALCQLGEILTPQGMVPKGRYLSIIVGLVNIFSGVMHGPPFVVSPESAAGIRAGGKTGLSTVVAGIMFMFTLFFGPFFSAIPPAGTAPILVMSGLMLVKNVQNVDFLSKFAVAAYMCIVLIPFTNSIFAGIGVGMTCWLAISFASGQFIGDSKKFYKYYIPVPVDGDAEADGDDANDSAGNPNRTRANSKSENSDSPFMVQMGDGDQATTNPIALATDNVFHSPRSRRSSSISFDTSPIEGRTSRRQSIVVALTDSEIAGGPETARFALNY
jgi:AGZA family xanthine/uracil permease-like MFS transporter